MVSSLSDAKFSWPWKRAEPVLPCPVHWSLEATNCLHELGTWEPGNPCYSPIASPSAFLLGSDSSSFNVKPILMPLELDITLNIQRPWAVWRSSHVPGPLETLVFRPSPKTLNVPNLIQNYPPKQVGAYQSWNTFAWPTGLQKATNCNHIPKMWGCGDPSFSTIMLFSAHLDLILLLLMPN